jgi:hypothetical protein
MALDLVTLVSAFFVICILSIAFRDNILYKFAERTFVGLMLGITITTSITVVINNGINPILKGQYFPIVAIILGLLLLTRLTPKQAWLGRYPIALITGLGLALWARSAVEANILQSIRPLMNSSLITTDVPRTAGMLFAWIGTIGGLSYFVFATGGMPKPLKPINDVLSRLGRYALMMYMGVAYAMTLMGRETLLLDRVLFLLRAFGLVS